MRSVLLTLALSSPLVLSSQVQANEDTDARLQFIQQQFNQTADHSELWQWGWFGIFSGSTLVQGGIHATTDDDKVQYDTGVGAFTSFLGAADMILNPMKNHSFAEELNSLPSATDAEKQAKLEKAERFLAEAAKRERYEQSWVNHVLAGVVNGLAGLAVAYDDKRPVDGWVTFATGMIATEAKIFTAPTSMIGAEEAYQAGDYRTAATYEPQRWSIAAAGPNLIVNWRF